jgi:hypothetical protein
MAIALIVQTENTKLKLKIGSSITVSPASTTTYDSPSQNVNLNAGKSTTTAASFTFDEDFPYAPNAKATIGDKASWAKWGVQSWGAGKVTEMDDGVEAYQHYRNGKGQIRHFPLWNIKQKMLLVPVL